MEGKVTPKGPLGCPVRILNLKTVQKLLGVWRGGVKRVGRSAAGSRGGGEFAGYPNIHTSK